MADQSALVTCRERIAAGHALVPEGRYQEALEVFVGALPALRHLLGSDHPEVQELVDDVAAVRSMWEVSAWSRQMGFREPPGVPGAPVAKPGGSD